MSDGSYLIGTDIGTLGTKTVLVDPSGRILSSTFEEYDVLTPKPLWAEQWPDVWLKAVCNTIRSAVEQSHVAPKEIAGVCISGLYGGSGVPCDKEIKPIRPCLIWMDRRAGDEVEWVRKNVGEKKLFKVTGNTVDPYYGFTKMLWIKFKEPKTWKKLHQFVTPNAYCIYKLTGNLSIDYSSAGNYGGIFDIHKRRWSDTMLEEMGIPKRLFPEKMLASKDIVDEVNEEGAKLTGLNVGTPVCAGGIDAPVSALSVGALKDGDLASMLGTSMCNGFIQDALRLSPKLVNYPYVAFDTKKLYSFAGITTAGACVRYFRDQLAKTEVSIAKEKNVSAYKILDEEAEKIPVGSEQLIFLPHMMVGERAPWWDPFVRSCLIGLTLHHTTAHIFRAFLEGISYAVRYSIETALEAGMPLRRTILVDGGAKSKLWRTILTDVTGLSMIYVAGAPGAPLGDALLAGVGTGILESYSAIDEWLEVTETTSPNNKNRQIYDRYYSVFKKTYKANEEIFKALHKIT